MQTVKRIRKWKFSQAIHSVTSGYGAKLFKLYQTQKQETNYIVCVSERVEYIANDSWRRCCVSDIKRRHALKINFHKYCFVLYCRVDAKTNLRHGNMPEWHARNNFVFSIQYQIDSSSAKAHTHTHTQTVNLCTCSVNLGRCSTWLHTAQCTKYPNSAAHFFRRFVVHNARRMNVWSTQSARTLERNNTKNVAFTTLLLRHDSKVLYQWCALDRNENVLRVRVRLCVLQCSQYNIPPELPLSYPIAIDSKRVDKRTKI